MKKQDGPESKEHTGSQNNNTRTYLKLKATDALFVNEAPIRYDGPDRNTLPWIIVTKPDALGDYSVEIATEESYHRFESRLSSHLEHLTISTVIADMEKSLNVLKESTEKE